MTLTTTNYIVTHLTGDPQEVINGQRFKLLTQDLQHTKQTTTSRTRVDGMTIKTTTSTYIDDEYVITKVTNNISN